MLLYPVAVPSLSLHVREKHSPAHNKIDPTTIAVTSEEDNGIYKVAALAFISVMSIVSQAHFPAVCAEEEHTPF